MALLLVTVIGRVALFAYLDANYYDGRDPRFTFPVMSYWWTLLLLATYAGAAELMKMRWARRDSVASRAPAS